VTFGRKHRKVKGAMNGRKVAAVTLVLLIVSSVLSLANTPPEPAFSAWRDPGRGETVVVFDASSSRDPDGQITVYQWTFGDKTTGSGTTAEHTYPTIGSYEVTLLVIDSAGSPAFLTETIDIASLPDSPAGEDAEQPAAAASVPVGTRVGERAPELALPDFDDRVVHLSDFLGKVVLLEFWRSTCPHCVASTPYLEELRQSFEDQDFVVILVVLDSNPAEAHLFLTENGYTGFITLRELDPTDHETAEAYGISGVPRAFLIDKTGVIRYTGGPGGIGEEAIAGWL